MNTTITNTTEDQTREVCETILMQLGGRRFVLMTGCKNFMMCEKTMNNHNIALRMDLTANMSCANRLKITLSDDDTYKMHFYRQQINSKTFEVKITKEQIFEGVYADQLRTIFQEVTGLVTKLF